MTKKTFSIAVIAGDGIGKEVMPEGLKALTAVAQRFDLDLQFQSFPWACAEHYQQHQDMLPADWFSQLQAFDAIYFGAVGWPDVVPDHVSLWGSLLKFRRQFDQYVNLRPVKLFAGVDCPLKGYQAGDIDFCVVRENTEGEYSAVGGKMFEGSERELVIQESIFTRHGTERILKFAFELATKRRHQLTAATKSNGIALSMPYWDDKVAEMATQYPAVTWDKQHIDILAARFVLQPNRFDVVVASNLFGDILSDLGPACTGTIGLAASANLNPERRFPSLFEPVHGSAPDIAGQNKANPIAMIWSAALMLEFFAEQDPRCQAAATAIMAAIEWTLREGIKTADLNGHHSTSDVGDAIVAHLQEKN